MFDQGRLVIYSSSQYVHWLCPFDLISQFSLVEVWSVSVSVACSMIRPHMADDASLQIGSTGRVKGKSKLILTI